MEQTTKSFRQCWEEAAAEAVEKALQHDPKPSKRQLKKLVEKVSPFGVDGHLLNFMHWKQHHHKGDYFIDYYYVLQDIPHNCMGIGSKDAKFHYALFEFANQRLVKPGNMQEFDRVIAWSQEHLQPGTFVYNMHTEDLIQI